MRIKALLFVANAMCLIPRADGIFTGNGRRRVTEEEVVIDRRKGMNIYSRHSNTKDSRKSTQQSFSSKKGQGKGIGNGSDRNVCTSDVARTIQDRIPEVVTRNPRYCCNFNGPTAVFVTHARASEDTESGFDIFWDTVYRLVLESSMASDVCFVMTGYDQKNESARSLSDILVDVNTVASEITYVPAIMTTDPTDTITLMNAIRAISDQATRPSIGVFNAGFTNVMIESLVSGKDMLPFIGHRDDRNYGTKAAEVALQILGTSSARPLCLNARPDIRFVGLRCESFYESISDLDVQPRSGVDCSNSVNTTEVAFAIIRGGISAVLAHSECCSEAEEAVRIARSRSNQDVVIGCMDTDTTGGKVDFVTAQAVELQAFQASNFAKFPTMRALDGDNGRAPQFFPSLQTFLNTEIFNTVIEPA